MKINEIIREKRKALSLTQEQVAEFLGVSTPAVNKWEKGTTYPDITLLPALARLLKTDLNTLLSFHDDLTDREIAQFVDGLDETVQEQGYDAAFQKAIHKIQEYPTCERLLYSAILYLEGALTLYNVSAPAQYQERYEPFYQRLAASDSPEIRDTATSMLISYARNRGDFSKAEELIHTLPFSTIDREEQLAGAVFISDPRPGNRILYLVYSGGYGGCGLHRLHPADQQLPSGCLGSEKIFCGGYFYPDAGELSGADHQRSLF